MTTKYRGHCQYCGREQAIVNGHMSKHGYTVKHGWFVGVCSGNQYSPIEVSREQTDKIIAEITAEIPQLIEQAEKVKTGQLNPKVISIGYGSNKTEIAFKDGNAMQQQKARFSLECALISRARGGESFIKTLAEVADKYNGKDLVVAVEKQTAPRISFNEIKVLRGSKVICKRIEGARVYFYWVNASPNVTSWVSTTFWRKLETA
jgi:hypothetical protein